MNAKIKVAMVNCKKYCPFLYVKDEFFIWPPVRASWISLEDIGIPCVSYIHPWIFLPLKKMKFILPIFQKNGVLCLRYYTLNTFERKRASFYILGGKYCPKVGCKDKLLLVISCPDPLWLFLIIFYISTKIPLLLFLTSYPELILLLT